MLSSKRAERLNAYRMFVSEQDDAELLRFYEKRKMPSVLGSERFVNWIKYRFSIEKTDDAVTQSRELAPDLDHLKRALCHYYAVTEEQLVHSRRGILNEPRNVVIYLCRLLRGDTLRTIAQHFGMSKYSSVSSVIERMKAEVSQLGGGTASLSPFRRSPQFHPGSLPPLLGRAINPRPATKGAYPLETPD